jgi:hypothetical protein
MHHSRLKQTNTSEEQADKTVNRRRVEPGFDEQRRASKLKGRAQERLHLGVA